MRPALPQLVLCLASSLAAQAPGPTAEGRIVDVLGEPVVAAEVLAMVGGKAVARTVADGEGIYRLRLPAGGAELRVRAPGKVDKSLPWRGLATPKVRHATLEDAATLSGRIVTADGRGAAHAIVVAVAQGFSSFTTQTDADGCYTLAGVPLRPLLLHALRDAARTDTALRVVGDTTCNLTLPEAAAACLVQVSDLPAMAAADAVVRVFGGDITAVQNGGRVPLRGDGTATLSLLADCLLEVPLAGFALEPGAQFATPTTRRAGFAVTGPAAKNPTTVHGRVRTLTDSAIAGVRIVVRDRSHCEIGTTFADATGAFRLQLALPPDGFCRFGLELGDWLLIDDEASVVDGFCWAPWPNVSKRVDLLAEATGAVRSVLRGPDGTCFALAEVVVAATAREHRELVRTSTDRAGQIALGLPAGEHELLAVTHDGKVARSLLMVEPGRQHAPEWQPVPAGEVAGVLRDAQGTAMPGVELLLLSSDLQGHNPVRAGERQRCAVLTDRLGRYRCRGLPVGSWFILSPTDANVGSVQVDVKAGQALAVDLAYGR
jgi:hypothetical protein